MSFFPRFPAAEFAPLFRVLDDFALNQASRSSGTFSSTQARTFQPRFDIQEGQDAYELHGELPGIDQKDISIEFTDAQTLSIKGRSERHSTTASSPAPAAAIEDARQDQGRTVSPAESDSSYHKATVEDEASASITTPSTEQAVEEAATTTAASQTAQPQSAHYWLSERSVGEFSRSFAFATRIDQDSVRASLKNGILSIVVPKAAPPALKRISIE